MLFFSTMFSPFFNSLIYFFNRFGLFLAFLLLVDMLCVVNSIYAMIDQAVHTNSPAK